MQLLRGPFSGYELTKTDHILALQSDYDAIYAALCPWVCTQGGDDGRTTGDEIDYIPLHSVPFRYIPLRSITFPLHVITFHYIPLRYIAFH